MLLYPCRTQSTAIHPSCSSAAGCCKNPTAPYQPSEKAVIESMHQQVGKKKESRTLNTKWYKDFSWIHVSLEKEFFATTAYNATKSGC